MKRSYFFAHGYLEGCSLELLLNSCRQYRGLLSLSPVTGNMIGWILMNCASIMCYFQRC